MVQIIHLQTITFLNRNGYYIYQLDDGGCAST
jgi:hypothetical protein